MRDAVTVNGHPAYCYTGGKPFDPARPTVVMVHGVLNDHSVWGFQSRHLAHHGWNVLAVDLPGHGRSEGEAPQSVEAAADCIVSLLRAWMWSGAALVGHSWGVADRAGGGRARRDAMDAELNGGKDLF